MQALKSEIRGKTPPESPPSPAAMQEPPIFTSAHSALMFAFNFSHGTLKKGFLAKALPPSAPGKGLAGLDGAAQAGMILLELSQLTRVRREIVTGRFAPQSKPCTCRAACCSGVRPTSDWSDAIHWLTDYVLGAGLTGNISHYRLRLAVVGRYFGLRESFVELADRLGVHRATVSELNKRVVEHLRGEERPAMYELDDRLKKAGIVAS